LAILVMILFCQQEFECPGVAEFLGLFVLADIIEIVLDIYLYKLDFPWQQSLFS
jgi:hypothetical protein